jgi:hypothetical protein
MSKDERGAAKNKGSDQPYSAHAIHLVRTAQLNTLTLSQMADQKASILMGATFLVFSLTVSRALVDEVSFAMVMLATTAFVSSLCAVIAVIPSVSKPKSENIVPNKLFFGHFSGLDEAQWTQDVLEELHADEHVFRMMLHDIYQNGQVLQGRKYKFLSIAYRIFIFGLFATMVVYLLELGGLIGV